MTAPGLIKPPNFGIATIPYAGDVEVVIVTHPDRPSIRVAKSSYEKPRAAFVDELVLRLFGTQQDGSPHEWELLEEPPATRVMIPVVDV